MISATEEVKILKEKHYEKVSFLNIHLIYTVVFDVETALENAELTVLEQIESQIFFLRAPYLGGDRLANFPQENFPVFYKNQYVIYV